eukprot:1194906-Prorocentrum_minimum.AAC.3
MPLAGGLGAASDGDGRGGGRARRARRGLAAPFRSSLRLCGRKAFIKNSEDRGTDGANSSDGAGGALYVVLKP